MLVSNWAQNYWAVSTESKKTIYDYKNVFGRGVESFIWAKDLDELSLLDIQELILTPIKTLYGKAELSGKTKKNPTIEV